MSKVTITITDTAESGVSLNVECDPPIDNRENSDIATPAQSAAACMLEAFGREYGSEGDDAS